MSDFQPSNILLITSTGVVFLLALSLLAGNRGSSRKPSRGPPRLPLIGNAHQVAQTHPWLQFSEWAKTYGDIIHLKILAQDVVVLSSAQVARDVLNKRSAIYSSRPHFTFACDLAGFGNSFVAMPYGDAWRAQRKVLAKHFMPGTVHQYYPMQESEACKLVLSLLNDVGPLERLVKRRMASIILRVLYGYLVRSDDDKFLDTGIQTMENFNSAFKIGRWLVDVIPILSHVPRWMPGSGFLDEAEHSKQVLHDTVWNPYNWCKQNLASDIVLKPNCCATVLTESDENLTLEDENAFAWAYASGFGGGSDTNTSTLLTFFLNMIRNPEVQAKARAEIDAVVGTDRLPNIGDKASLPYVRSIITEVYRWMPVVPLGTAHALDEEDVYDGIYLPKGTIVVPNVWHMLHDSEAYPDPMAFNPDRYQRHDSEMKKVTDLVFGFGRRACPGFYFAEGTIFATFATILATCEILPPLDASGKEYIPDVDYTSTVFVLPKPYKCRFRCRSPQVLDMLQHCSSAE